jgi:urease accessory protein
MNGISRGRLGAIAVLAAAAVATGPSMALAHIGVGPIHDLSHGFENPLARAGYILALLALGIWATRRTGGAIWRVPLRFLLAILSRSGK